MNKIPSLKDLFLKLGIFTAVFTSLILFSSLDSVRNAHNSFYCSVTNVLFNSINPEIRADFATEDRKDRRHFGIAIELYDKNKFGKRKLTKAQQRQVRPDVTKYPNLHALVLVPSIFLLCLFVVTPIPIKSKLWKIPVALLIFYIILVFYYSYVFSMTLNNGQFEVDSFWHFIVRLFGVDNTELINIFVLIIWAGLSIPQMLQLQSSTKKKTTKKVKVKSKKPAAK